MKLVVTYRSVLMIHDRTPRDFCGQHHYVSMAETGLKLDEYVFNNHPWTFYYDPNERLLKFLPFPQ